jgi:hypothetical protein
MRGEWKEEGMKGVRGMRGEWKEEGMKGEWKG